MARPRQFTAEQLHERKKAQRLAWYAKNRERILQDYKVNKAKPKKYEKYLPSEISN